MVKQQLDSSNQVSRKASLRRRIKSLYQKYNWEDWQRCYLHIDPRLRQANRIALATYADSLTAFKRHYGTITIWHVKINLYLNVKKNKHDDRPFAYVYVFWQDDRKQFHVFRERWVHDSGRWYTRVVGLVVHRGLGMADET